MASQRCLATWSSEDIVRNAVSELVYYEASYLRSTPKKFDLLERIQSTNQIEIRVELYRNLQGSKEY